ncbi:MULTISPECIES: phage tail protein [Proteus]|uniref:phage tail protein n=1 Tax=Proteus TaxID=583 RepID=UPI001376BD12|nr:phage tail protein [Proteus sp. G2658]NBM90476.1 phage tail protein [Proteus sp. G2658]
MSAKFFALLTVIGANKLAKATALGTTLKITQMAVGDGGGTLPTPDTQQTKLVGEKRRAGLNTLFVDPKNDSQIIAEQVIPENEGGYWIREIGLFDDEGSLIAVGNCPETYKPQLQEGSGRTQTIRMILTVSHTESVELKVDPSVILATREFVNDAIESASKEILKAVEETYATKEDVKKKFNIDNVVHEKGASKEKVISQFGATEIFQPKGTYPTKAEMTQELNKKVDKSSISQQLANDVSKVPSLDLLAKELGKKQGIGNYQPTGNYALKTDLNNYQPKGNYAPAGNYVTMASMNLELNKKIDKSSISQQVGNDINKVPSLDLMAKELGKKQAAGSYALKTDLTNYQPKGDYVTASTMNVELNKKIDKLSISQQLANDVNKVPSLDLLAKELGKKQPAGSYVPNTRKINGKQLNNDISLNAGDVGALNQGQGDGRYVLKNDAENNFQHRGSWKVLWKASGGAGTGLVAGSKATLTDDIRNKIAFISLDHNLERWVNIYIPQDNLALDVMQFGKVGLFFTTNNGKTLNCKATADAQIYGIAALI